MCREGDKLYILSHHGLKSYVSFLIYIAAALLRGRVSRWQWLGSWGESHTRSERSGK